MANVADIERVGIGLVVMGCAMAENDHVPALAQGVDGFRLRRRGWLLAAAGKNPNTAHSNASRMMVMGVLLAWNGRSINRPGHGCSAARSGASRMNWVGRDNTGGI